MPTDQPATAAGRGQRQPPKPGVIKMGLPHEEVLPTPAAPWPLGTLLAGDQCHALPPKRYIQQWCLVRKDHVENGHPHQNYGGLIWSDTEATDGT